MLDNAMIHISVKKVKHFDADKMAAGWRRVALKSFSQIAAVVTEAAWCPAVYRDNYRKGSNFERAGLIVLDFDGGYRLDTALAAISAARWRHVVGTTKSHGVDGMDRFRVILQPAGELPTDFEHYKAVMAAIQARWPGADTACKDAARFYWPCREIVSLGDGRLYLPPRVVYDPNEKIEAHEAAHRNFADLGVMPRWLSSFLENGAPPGERRPTIFNTAFVLGKEGLGYHEVFSLIIRSPFKRDKINDEELTRHVKRGWQIGKQKRIQKKRSLRGDNGSDQPGKRKPPA